MGVPRVFLSFGRRAVDRDLDDFQPALGGVFERAGCAAGPAVKRRDEDARGIDHVAVAAHHAPGGVGPTFARSQRLPVDTVEYVMMGLIAVTIVSTLRLVGIVLAISLLTVLFVGKCAK